MGQTECDAFKAEANKLDSKEMKNLKSKIAALAKVAGKDITEKLLKELGLS